MTTMTPELHHGPPPQPAAAPPVSPSTSLTAFDPFQLMDRLDEDALKKELDGIVDRSALVYVVKDGGKEIVGLSKVGVDECRIARSKLRACPTTSVSSIPCGGASISFESMRGLRSGSWR